MPLFLLYRRASVQIVSHLSIYHQFLQFMRLRSFLGSRNEPGARESAQPYACGEQRYAAHDSQHQQKSTDKPLKMQP